MRVANTTIGAYCSDLFGDFALLFRGITKNVGGGFPKPAPHPLVLRGGGGTHRPQPPYFPPVQTCQGMARKLLQTTARGGWGETRYRVWLKKKEPSDCTYNATRPGKAVSLFSAPNTNTHTSGFTFFANTISANHSGEISCNPTIDQIQIVEENYMLLLSVGNIYLVLLNKNLETFAYLKLTVYLLLILLQQKLF